MKKNIWKRVLALILAVSMLAGDVLPARATEGGTSSGETSIESTDAEEVVTAEVEGETAQEIATLALESEGTTIRKKDGVNPTIAELYKYLNGLGYSVASGGILSTSKQIVVKNSAGTLIATIDNDSKSSGSIAGLGDGTYTVTQQSKGWWDSSWSNGKSGTFTVKTYHEFEVLVSGNEISIADVSISSGNGDVSFSNGKVTVYKDQFPIMITIPKPELEEGETLIMTAALGSNTVKFADSGDNLVATLAYPEGIDSTYPLTIEAQLQQNHVISTTVNNIEYGTVQINGVEQENIEALSGEEVTLTASAKDGYTFVRWYEIVDGKKSSVSDSNPHTIVVNKDAQYEAVFAPSDKTYVVKNSTSGKLYSQYEFQIAFQEAKNGDAIVLINDMTLSEPLTIPSGIAFLLPYQAGAEAINDAQSKIPYSNAKYTSKGGMVGPEDTAKKNVELTVNDTSIVVSENARLITGGEIGSASNGFAGQTCGWHSDIILNNSTINVEGILSSYGYITGGVINVSSTGVVYKPFIVDDFKGGTYTAVAYGNDMSPFNRHSALNIQSDMNYEYGSRLVGYVYLFAGSKENYSAVNVIGVPEDNEALIKLQEGAKVSSFYDADRVAKGFEKVGHRTVNITGGATFGSMTLDVGVATVTTNTTLFPLPYNYTINLLDDENDDVESIYKIGTHYKLLPGSNVYVGEGARLELNAGIKLQVYDGLVIKSYSAPNYPSGAQLAYPYGDSCAYSESASLIVDGTFVLKSTTSSRNPTTFSGVIQSKKGTGKVQSENVTLGATIEEGIYTGDDYMWIYKAPDAMGSNKTRKELKAQIWDKKQNALVDITADSTYYALDGDTIDKEGKPKQLTGTEYYLCTASANDGVASTYTYQSGYEPVLAGSWIDPKIVFEDGEGIFASGSVAEYTGEPGSTITFPTCTRPGYDFKYWKVKKSTDTNDKNYYGPGYVTIMPKAVMTLEPEWEAKTYTVALQNSADSPALKITDDGWTSASGKYTQTYKVSDTEKTITLPQPEAEGYNFMGWIQAEGETPNKNVTIEKSTVKDYSFTAVWEKKQYDITLHLNGGTNNTGTPANENGTVTIKMYYDDVISIAGVARTGYEGPAWKVKNDNGEFVDAPAKVPANNMTLYATWLPKTYAVTFDPNGGTLADQTQASQTFTYDDTLSLPEVLASIGYKLKGWFDASVGGTQIIEGSEFKPTTDTPVYYAQWEPIEYKITLDTDNGVISADGWSEENGVYTGGTYKITDVNGTMLPNPTKPGYTFAGWSGNNLENFGTNWSIIGGTYGDQTYTALWTGNNVEVTLNTNAPDVSLETNEFTVTYGGTYGTSLPAELTRTGYEFDGWYTEDNKKVTAESDVASYEAHTLTAKWTAKEYVLKFQNGEEVLAERTVSYGTVLDEVLLEDLALTEEELAGFEKEGHTFSGWFVGDTQYFTESCTLTMPEGITVYPKYTVNTYKLTLKLNGAAYNGALQTDDKIELEVSYGANLSEYFSKVSKTGYIGPVWENLGGSYTGTVMPANDLVLNATWVARPYIIRLTTDGDEIKEAGWVKDEGNAGEFTKTFTIEDEIITLPEKPTKTGHTFTGWNGEAKVGVTAIDPTAVIPTMATGDTDLAYTAQWEVNEYTISFENTGDSVIPDITQAYDTPVTRPADPVKTGHTFDGWDIEVPAKMPAKDLVVTAQWKVNQYSIRFIADGETVETIEAIDYGTKLDQTFAEALPEVEKTGYTFEGWWITENGVKKECFVEESDVTLPVDGLDVYAKFTPNSYKVTLNANAEDAAFEEGAVQEVALTYDEAYGTFETPSRAGHTFMGWNTKADGSGKDVVSTDIFRNDGDIVVTENALNLYAQWKANDCTLTFMDGTEVIATRTIAYGSVLNEELLAEITKDEAIEAPVVEGYSFIGWFVGDTQYFTENCTETITEAGLTVYPKREINTHTLTLRLHGGTYAEEEKEEVVLADIPYGTELAPYLANAAKVGYLAPVWLNFGELYTGTTMPDSALTLDADWIARNYTVILQTDGDAIVGDEWTFKDGSYVRTFTIEDGEIVLPETPTKTGYTFDGWNGWNGQVIARVESFVPADMIPTMGDYDVEYTAQWTVNQYTISFVNTGDTQIPDITQDFNSNVTTPENPSREGYTFLGWKPLVPATMPAEDVVVEAQWRINTYDVTFVADGMTAATLENVDYATAFDEQYENIPEAPEKDGYTFAGWFTGQNGTGKQAFVEGSEVKVPVGGMTLYAKYVPNVYEIIFDGNTGTGSAPEAVKATFDAAVTLPECTYEKEGYHFAGWYTEEEKSLNTGDTYTIAKDITLYAHWEANTYTVSFHANGGEGEMAAQNFTYDNVKALAGNSFTRSGYTFLGWAFAEDKEAVVYEDKEEVNLVTEQNGNVDLYAVWKANEYTVTFDANQGALGLFDPKNKTVIYDDAYGNLPEPSRTGYSFDGWYTEKDAGTKVEADSFYQVADDSTLYAHWVAKTYEVTLYHGYDEVTSAIQVTFDKAYSYGTDGTNGLSNPTRKGYIFIGWYTEPDKNGEKVEVSDVIETEEFPKTLYGYWEAVEYTINYSGTEACTNELIRGFDGDELPLTIRRPERPAYTFAGWTGYNGTTPELDFTIPEGTAEDINLTANWIPNEYNISYDVDGGIMPEEYVTSYNIEETPVVLPTPAKAGYTFFGWKGSLLEQAAMIQLPEGTYGDKELTAIWGANDYTVTLDANASDATVDGASATEITVTYDESYSGLVKPERTGYTFTGWNTEADGSGTFIEKTDTVENTDTITVTDSTLTLYAQWSANDYTVRFDANSGTGEMADVELSYDESLALPANTFEREGYTFAGWAVEEDKLTVKYGDTEVITNLKSENGDVITLYAVWTANEYTVVLNTAQGVLPEGADSEITVTYDSVYGTLPTPERTGYIFDGWFTEAVDGTKVNADSKYTVADDSKLYAHWTAKTYEIELRHGYKDKDDLEIVSKIRVTFDQAFSYGTDGNNGLKELSRTGYEFRGWYTKANGQGEKVELDNKIETEEFPKTLYGYWNACAYDITYAGVEECTNVLTEGFNSDELPLELPDAVRPAYTFEGWTGFNGETPQTGYVIPVGTAESISLIANWTPIGYSISYDVAGGVMPEEAYAESYIITDTPVMLPVPSRTGYTFGGWDSANPLDAEVLYFLAQGTYGNKELKAIWNANSYTVTLNANAADATVDGAAEKELTVTYDQAYGTLPTPVREGYLFDGWHTVTGTKVEGSDTVAITENQTLYAKWSPITYTIAFDANGGTGEMSELTFTYDEGKALLANAFLRNGYTFQGWAKDAEANIADYAATEEVMNLTNVNEDRVTLYAVWTRDDYTITYDGLDVEGVTNKEALGENPDSYHVESGDITLVNPERTGYTFGGWSDGTTTDTDVTVENGSTGNITYTATWQANDYEVNLNLGGGTLSEGQEEKLTVTYDSVFGTLPVPSRTGYTFAGWFYSEQTAARNVPVQVTEATIAKNNEYVTITDEENPATIYAHWNPINYTVTFNIDGADENSLKPEDMLCYFDGEYDIPSVVPSRTGYEFLGWTTEVNGTDALSSIKNLVSVYQEAPVTLYAIWQAKDFTVTFDANGGTVTPESKKVTYDQAYGELPVPEREGHTFLGWSEGTTVYTAETVVQITADQTLTAQWQVNSYTVTLYDEEVQIGAAYTFAYGTAVSVAVPEKTGYTFKEWNPALPETMPANNVEAKAVWTANDYTITFDSAGGSSVAAITQGYETTVKEPKAPTRAGYAFEGWFTADGTQYFANGTEKMPLNGVSLTAAWTANEYKIYFRSQNAVYLEQTAACDSVITAPAAPEREGYTFDYWYAIVDNKEVKYFTEDGNTTMPAADLYLFAAWKKNDYTITFDANGGTGDMPVQSYVYDEYQALTENAFTREGYKFLGWKLTADGDGVSYTDKQNVQNLTTQANGNVTLYAHWEIQKYSVTLRLWDEITGSKVNYNFTGDENWKTEVVNAEYQATYDNDFGTEIPAPAMPTRTGYDFAGWFDADGNQYFEAVETIPAKDIVLTAQWKLKTCTISYGNVEECTFVPEPIVAEYGTKISAPQDPVREGYTFDGWYTDPTFAIDKKFVFGENTTMPESRVLFANWTINSYVVSFANTGETTVKSYDLVYKGEVQKPVEIPVLKGYEFKHWSLSENGEEAVFPVSMPANNLVIYAVYDSWLTRLQAIDTTDGSIDFAGEGELELAREYYAKLNDEQIAEYKGTEHQIALFAKIKEVSTLQLRKDVVAAQDATNAKLANIKNGEDDVIEQLAEMKVFDENYTAEPPVIDAMIIEDQYAAINMLSVEFMTELFAYEEIYGILCDDDEIPDEELKEHVLTGETIESAGTLASDQFNIMLVVAWAALNPQATENEFVNWLQSQMNTLQLEVLDGKSIWATVKAKTSEGVEYSVKYRLNFYSETHNLNYDLDGGTADQNPLAAKYCEVVTLENPVKRGYTFLGWETEDIALTDNTFTMGKTDVNLKALWQRNDYQISLDLGKGSLIDAVAGNWPLTYTAETEMITLPTENQLIAPTGYTFGGWYVDNEETAVKDISLSPKSDQSMKLEDITYKAKWIPVNYTMTLQLEGGAFAEETDDWNVEEDGTYTRTFTVESTDVVLPELERYGYTFVGWDKALTIPLTAADITLTAQWTAVDVPVTLHYNDGTGMSSQTTVTYDGFFGNLPNPPERTGYGFDGWFTEAEGGEKYDGTVRVESTDRVELYAHWTAGSFNITYAGMEGATNHKDNPNSYVVDTEVELHAPVKVGYTFAGWTGDSVEVKDGRYYLAAGTVGTQTVTANWTVNQYTIKFVDDTDEELYRITQDYNSAVTAPANPVREGYTFDGWSREIPTLMPAENITIKATWKINSHSITFVDRDGNVQAVNTYNFGEEMIVQTPKEVEGYTFTGWFDANGKKYFEQTEYMPDHDLTVTAQYSVNQYTITFDTDCDTELEAVKADYGTVVAAPEEPVKEGHTFVGWFAEDGTEYFAKTQGVAKNEVIPAHDVNLKAEWTVNEYKIWFMDGEEELFAIDAKYGESIAQTAQPSKIGYAFAGWSPELPATMPAENLTVYAQWEANQYNVAFNGNGAIEGTIPATMTDVNYDQVYELPADVPERTGYTFVGWTTDSSASEPMENIYNLTASNNATVTLYAIWEARSFTVTLDPNGGSVAPESIKVTYDGTYENLPTPEREGYSFNGWSDGSTTYTTGSVVKITTDQTLTAQWTEKGDTPYKVVHHLQNLDNDEYVEDKTVEYTGRTNGTATATSESYTGFALNVEKSAMTGTIQADGSLVLDLYYDRIEYMVSWNVAGTTVQEMYRYGAMPEFKEEADYEDDHGAYTFKAWDKELVKVETDAVYTAQYEVDYEASIGDVTYITLEKALEKAKAGETVRLDKDITLEKDLVIPVGVNLLLPCIDDDYGYNIVDNGKLKFNHDGTSTAGTTGVGPNAKLYRTLTVPENVTITVKGNILVNSVSGRPSGGTNDMDITGGYAQMMLDGKIIVLSGGNVDCFGYIKGSGSVTAESGGSIGDLYIVRHWRGGTQAFEMYQSIYRYGDPENPDIRQVYPMNEYDCHNIETDVIIKYGASYDGMVKMCANAGSGNAYYHTRFPQVNVQNGMIKLTDKDGYVVRTYDEETQEEVFNIYGGANFSESSLNISGVNLSTRDFLYPMDGDISYNLMDGDYHFVNDYKFLPGGGITVHSGSTLTVDDGVYVAFYDEFNDVKNTGDTQYPLRDKCVIYVKENAKFINAGTFGGSIVTESPDILIGDYPTWGITTLEANGYCNKTVQIEHELFITREGYDWRFGDPALGEVKDSIIWIGADYSELEKALDTVPEDLNIYSDETAEPLKAVIDEIEYGLGKDKQKLVDQWTEDVLKYVDRLKLREVKVMLDPNGGECTKESIVVTYGDAYEKLPDPEYYGFKFLGWYDEDNMLVTNETVMKKIVEEIVLTARWEMIPADYTKVNEAIAKIPDDMTGYTEESVKAVKEAQAAVDITLGLAEQDKVDAMADAILEAIENLERVQVNVSFNSNGGNTIDDVFELRYGDEYPYDKLPVPEREGFNFIAWYTAKEGGTEIKEGTKVASVTDIILYAKWEDAAITEPGDYSLVEAAKLKIPADMSPYTSASVNRLNAAVEAVVYGLTIERQDDINAWAAAIEQAIAGLEYKTITVYFDPNGGVCETKSMQVTYGTAIAEMPQASKEYHDFLGWYTAKEGGDKVEASALSTKTENLTLYAQYQILPADYSQIEEVKKTIPELLACYSDASQAALQRALDQIVEGYTADKQSVVNRWAEELQKAIDGLVYRTLTMTYDAQGGKVSPKTATIVYNESINWLPVPERTYHRFDGWFTEPEGGLEVTVGTVITNVKDFSIYAHWTQVDADYTRVFAALEKVPEDYEIYYTEESVAKLENAINAVVYDLDAGYQRQVDNWALDIEIAIRNLQGKSFKVSFEYNGGEKGITSRRVRYGESYREMPVTTKEGYSFVGWYTAQTGGTRVNSNDIMYRLEDHTLYARWSTGMADYSGVEEAIARIPADFSDIIYTEESVKRVNDAVAAVQYELPVTEQAKVDAWAMEINAAVDALEKYANKQKQEAPDAPELVETTSDSLTVRVMEGHEYSLDGKNWQTSGTFTGLDNNVEYTVYARLPETKTHYASEISEALMVKLPCDTDEPAEHCPSKHFRDLDLTAWYHLDVDFVVENDYMKGTINIPGFAKFSPQDATTRAMIISILYRMSGEKATEEEMRQHKFEDVPKGSYFEEAVAWAASRGITYGVSPTRFAPEENTTREQMMNLMYRYAEYYGYNTAMSAAFEAIDMDDVSEWAIAGIDWANAVGMIYGIPDKDGNIMMAPQKEVTRVEAAAFIHRFCDKFE